MNGDGEKTTGETWRKEDRAEAELAARSRELREREREKTGETKMVLNGIKFWLIRWDSDRESSVWFC